jgi:hypothetical protein
VSRAHCLDCGTDVPVDPLGHCPEGHLLPAQGRRVESAIGSDDYHPDEPEPWVAQVDAPATTGSEDVVPSAEPTTAPGLAPAERETTTGDLLRELGSLHAADERPPSPADDAGPSAPSAMAAPTEAPPAPPNPARFATAPQHTPSTSAGPDPAVSEHSALEQALQSLEDSHQVPDVPAPTEPGTPAPAEPGTPAASEPASPVPALDDDLSSLFEELEGLDTSTGSNGSTPAASAAPPTPPPATSQPPTAPPPVAAPSQPTAPPAAAQSRPTRRALRDAGELASAPPAPPTSDDHAGNGHADNGHADNGHGDAEHGDAGHDASVTARGLDTMNFTAKGGAMNGRRRRRLLGR